MPQTDIQTGQTYNTPLFSSGVKKVLNRPNMNWISAVCIVRRADAGASHTYNSERSYNILIKIFTQNEVAGNS
jgi:hypothetical protein